MRTHVCTLYFYHFVKDCNTKSYFETRLKIQLFYQNEIGDNAMTSSIRIEGDSPWMVGKKGR